MISFTKAVSVICVSLLFLLSSGPVPAQYQDFKSGKSEQKQARFYGKGQPKSTEDLPPGQLRKSLENLRPYAKSKALRWLQEFSFPASDVKNLRVNAHGAIHYADSFLPPLAAAGDVDNLSSAPAVSATEVFKLHSKPGSSNVVYLDFDGHTIEATAWNVNRAPVLVALPFDPSQNDSPKTVANFTQDELNRIAEIWHRMSEDFAAFDIDVTTEEPDVFTSTTGRVLFTSDTDAYGASMPSRGAGGTAWVNPWGRSNYPTYYSPALVYYKNLGGSATYNAEAGSHELGHNLGLSHDGTSSTSYYKGHGNGLVDWAPIMGNSYSRNVTQWSAGDYPNANNTQDDLAIIAEELGYVADDHSNSAGTATPIKVEADGSILVSSPELDPGNVLTENKGVIDDRTDVDWFYFDLAAEAMVNIIATPAWHSFERNDLRGANLDIELTLYDSGLALLELADPVNDSSASLSMSLSAGRYYVQIDGVGNDSNSNYSDYSSLGMYFLEGSIQTEVSNNQAPTPSTMSWAIAPHATGENSLSMTAVLATDDSGAVEYKFSCVTGGNSGCTDSGWQTSRTWSPGGLEANTYYAYKVIARDTFGLTNTASPTMGDTTDAPVVTPPVENTSPSAVAFFAPAPAIITKGKTVEVTFDGSDSTDADGSIVSWQWRDADGLTVSTSSVFSRKLNAGTHNYTLIVTDDTGATSNVELSVSVTKGGDDGGGGGGGGKKCNPRKQDCG